MKDKLIYIDIADDGGWVDNFHILVADDATDEVIQAAVDRAVEEWSAGRYAVSDLIVEWAEDFEDFGYPDDDFPMYLEYDDWKADFYPSSLEDW